MNTGEMNGKLIANVRFPPDVDGQVQLLKTEYPFRVEMSATHHGDHDEFWIVVKQWIHDRWVEVSRHNPRYVDGWDWYITQEEQNHE